MSHVTILPPWPLWFPAMPMTRPHHLLWRCPSGVSSQNLSGPPSSHVTTGCPRFFLPPPMPRTKLFTPPMIFPSGVRVQYWLRPPFFGQVCTCTPRSPLAPGMSMQRPSSTFSMYPWRSCELRFGYWISSSSRGLPRPAMAQPMHGGIGPLYSASKQSSPPRASSCHFSRRLSAPMLEPSDRVNCSVPCSRSVDTSNNNRLS
mmetsp:Transcript_148817/g.414625  ORF Transcript_148817/g.414625 Transcript_148817/m.414625 type:complete len:202 (-) Transcript_148817:287-892(-)